MESHRDTGVQLRRLSRHPGATVESAFAFTVYSDTKCESFNPDKALEGLGVPWALVIARCMDTSVSVFVLHWRSLFWQEFSISEPAEVVLPVLASSPH